MARQTTRKCSARNRKKRDRIQRGRGSEHESEAGSRVVAPDVVMQSRVDRQRGARRLPKFRSDLHVVLCNYGTFPDPSLFDNDREVKRTRAKGLRRLSTTLYDTYARAADARLSRLSNRTQNSFVTNRYCRWTPRGASTDSTQRLPTTTTTTTYVVWPFVLSRARRQSQTRGDEIHKAQSRRLAASS